VQPRASLTTLPPKPLPAIHALGADFPAYTPIYQRSTQWVDAEHEAIANLPVEGALIRGDVPGFLRPADALLLYEVAFYAPGNIMELGSAWGLSTSILCRAIRGSGRVARVTSIEIDPLFQKASLANIRNGRLEQFFEILAGSATERLPDLVSERKQFGMAFVDHDHSLAATREACTALEHLLMPGGFAVFHDFNDARNVDEPAVYGVFKGVCEWLAHSTNFAYVGTIGCCGLVQRRAV